MKHVLYFIFLAHFPFLAFDPHSVLCNFTSFSFKLAGEEKAIKTHWSCQSVDSERLQMIMLDSAQELVGVSAWQGCQHIVSRLLFHT